MSLRISAVRRALAAVGNREKARFLQKYFKTGKGEYGEGDRFIGATVPQLRRLAKQFRDLDLKDAVVLLRSGIHEERLLALLIWVDQFSRFERKPREKIVKLFLKHTRYINNWDLVDSSAPYIVGPYVEEVGDSLLLDRLSRSKLVWERRISVLATLHFIRQGDFADLDRISRRLLKDPHDLIHKAVGWMLREAGKRDLPYLIEFLDQNASEMPRTMLRYAIEKLSDRERRDYLAMRTA